MKLETTLNVGLAACLLVALAHPVARGFVTDDVATLRVTEQVMVAAIVCGAGFLIARKFACGG